MKNYTAMISWAIYGRRGAMYRSKTCSGIRAESILEAREIALAKAPAGTQPQVNCIWYN